MIIISYGSVFHTGGGNRTAEYGHRSTRALAQQLGGAAGRLPAISPAGGSPVTSPYLGPSSYAPTAPSPTEPAGITVKRKALVTPLGPVGIQPDGVIGVAPMSHALQIMQQRPAAPRCDAPRPRAYGTGAIAPRGSSETAQWLVQQEGS